VSSSSYRLRELGLTGRRQLHRSSTTLAPANMKAISRCLKAGLSTRKIPVRRFGLNSAYALGQILFAALALLALSPGLMVLDRWPGLILGFLAASGWMAICVQFLEYRQPRMTVALFAALLAAAALTPYR
jgi:hypothetical protein